VSFREFCVFADSDSSIVDSTNAFLFNNKFSILSGIFKNSANSTTNKRISFVQAQGYDENNNPLAKVVLPVICSSFGNACVLSFKYEDNYSAGNYSDYAVWYNDENIKQSGFFTETTPYTDVYGKIKYLSLDFIADAQINSNKKAEDYLRYPPNNNDAWLSGTSILSTTDKPLQVEKGNTEILSFNYQLEFVSTREDIIIGSGLAKNITLVKDSNSSNDAKLFYFNNRLNKFESEVDTSQGVKDDNFNNSTFKISNLELVYNPDLPQGKSYKSWALVAPFEVKDGNSTKIVYQLLIGCNMTIDSSTTNIFAGNGHSGLKMRIVTEKDLYK
jgi:hypothetical protein